MNYIDFDSNKLQKFELEDTAVSNGSLVGTCELGKANIQLLNDSNEYSSFKGKWIKTIHGSFYVYDVKPIQEKVNIQLSCYDIKYKLDVPYEQQKFDSLFPCAIKTWRKAIAEEYGIIFNDNDNYPFADLELNVHPYVGDEPSVRNVLQVISQACVSFVETDESDNFYFSWVKENEPILIKDWLELTTEQKATDPVNEAVLGRGDVEDIVIWPKPAPENPKEFRIDNNYILDPQDTESDSDRRLEVIKDVYDRVNGFSYVIYDMRTQSADDVFAIKLGSKIKYIDLWGNELESIVMSKTLVWLGGDINNSNNYELKISADQVNETSSELSYAGNINDTIDKLSVSVDKNNKKIELLASSTSELSEKVTKVEETAEGLKSSVSNVEKGLADTNTNLQNTDKKVKGLEDNLNGLSTNFNDFKDNEYLKSIKNLQDQIDGAIQFWKGNVVPTLNNYPASDWETTQDRDNHLGDIYYHYSVDEKGNTIALNGYRFDNVDGKYQWILLSDTELAAVQKLADEALNKATENEKNIGVLNQKTSELSQSDEEIKASVELLDNQYKKDMTLENTVYGNPAYIENASDNSLVENVIYGATEQETRSGKNFLHTVARVTVMNGVTFTAYQDGTVVANGTATERASHNLLLERMPLAPNTYIVSGCPSGGEVSKTYYMYYSYYDEENILKGQLSFTDDIKITIRQDVFFNTAVIIEKGYTADNLVFKPMLRLASIEDDTYEPYGVMPSPEYPSEIRNIEGIENLLDMSIYDTMNNNGGNTYDASNHRITFTEDKVAENRGRYRSIVRSFKKGDRVTLTFDLRSSRNSKVKAGIEAVKAMCDVTTEWKRFSTIYNVTKDIDHIMTIFYSDKSSTFEKGDWIEFKDVTLLVNNDYTGYIPYGNKYLVERVTGKNIFNTFFEQGSISSESGENTSSTTLIRTADFIKVKPNGEYIISNDGSSLGINVYEYDKDNKFIGRLLDTVVGGSSFIVSSNTYYIKLGRLDISLTKFQVELGNKITDYEEYKERTYLIPLKKENLFDSSLFEVFTSSLKYITLNLKPNTYYTLISDIPRSSSNVGNLFLINSSTSVGTGINDVYSGITRTIKTLEDGIVKIVYRDNGSELENEAKAYFYKLYEGKDADDYYSLIEINDTKDEYDVSSGVLTKRQNKIIFSGNESWTYSIINDVFYTDFLKPLSKQNTRFLCSHYKNIPNTVYYSTINDGEICFEGKNTRLLIKDNRFNNADSFKNWLTEQYNAGTPVTIEYELDEPYSIQLNPIEIKTFDGVNNIYVEDKYSLVNQNKIVYLTDSFLNTKYASKAELKVASDSIKESINSTLEKDYTSKTEFNVTKDLIESLRNKVYDLTNYIKMITASDVLKLDNTFDSNGAINYLKITNFSSYKKLYPGQQHPSKYTYPGLKSEYTLIFADRQDAPLNKKEITFISPVELNGNSTISDEVVIQDNKIKIIQKVDNTGKALSSPIEYDALYSDSSSILTTFDNNTFIMLKDEANVKFECEYLMKNELTNRFATTMELMAQQILTEEMWKSTIKKGELSTEIQQTAEIIKFTNGKLIIDMDNFKLDSVGNVTLANGAKIIGGYGLLTFMTIPSTILSTEFVGGHMMLPLSPRASLEFQFSIPKNFKVEKAYIVLNHAPTKTGYYNGAMTPTYYNGYCRHLKLYRASNISNLLFEWIVGGNTTPKYENTNYTEIPNAFGVDGFTGSSSGNTKVTSIDIKDFIASSNEEDTFNIFTIKTSDLVPEDYTEELKETGICLADLTIIGYMSFDK